jgi:hypothetical protein
MLTALPLRRQSTAQQRRLSKQSNSSWRARLQRQSTATANLALRQTGSWRQGLSTRVASHRRSLTRETALVEHLRARRRFTIASHSLRSAPNSRRRRIIRDTQAAARIRCFRARRVSHRVQLLTLMLCLVLAAISERALVILCFWRVYRAKAKSELRRRRVSMCSAVALSVLRRLHTKAAEPHLCKVVVPRVCKKNRSLKSTCLLVLWSLPKTSSQLDKIVLRIACLPADKFIQAFWI